jgi:hypothetical protein
MKNREVTHVHNNSPRKYAPQSTQLFASAIGVSAALIYELMELVFLPFRICVEIVRFFDSLVLVSVRWLARLCFGTLAMAILGDVLFAFVRTIFHPWFG